MNRVSLGEIKAYLGIDGEEQNALLSSFSDTAESICEKVLRSEIDDETPHEVKTAILYIIWQLYFHRDGSEFNAAEMESTVAVMLSGVRRQEF